MIVELNKEDLISLVKGIKPDYKWFKEPLVSRCGNYVGGLVDDWFWNSNLEDLSEEELWELYTICKQN